MRFTYLNIFQVIKYTIPQTECNFYMGSHFLIIFAEIWIRYFLNVYDDSYQDYLKGFLIFCHKFEILQYFGDKLYSGKSGKIKIFKTAN